MSKLIRRLIGGAALVTAVVGLLAATASATPARHQVAVQRTKHIHVRPVTKHHALSQGWTAVYSSAAVRCHYRSPLGANTYDCRETKTGGFVYNCVYLRGGYAACGGIEPWYKTVTAYRLVGKMTARKSSPKSPRVLGVQLSTGLRCGYILSGGDEYHGRRVDYGCGSHRRPSGVLHGFNRGKVWHVQTVRYTKNYKVRLYKRFALAKTWQWDGVRPPKSRRG